jgi:hypothetical protein
MISRRKLYQAGEPLGQGVTRREAGRTIYGGGGDSSSASENTQTTVNTDARIANQGGAVVGAGASVTGLTVNDPTAQIHAMDVTLASTQAALAASNAATQAANASMQKAMQEAADASIAAANAAAAAAQQSSRDSADVSKTAMAGTWGATANLQTSLIEGMNTVLSSSQSVMDMENAAFKQVGSQIQTAFESASDISTGNKQLVTVGMIAVGLVAMMAMNKRGMFA